MYTEDRLLPISALQHLLFCPRQCALIHIERHWAENRFTAEGSILHAVADSGRSIRRGETNRRGAVPIKSLRLGLTGVADVIEFTTAPDGSQAPYPVEYKRGAAKNELCDKVQLCAQAMCLEEMMNVSVPEGALFYGKNRRRTKVMFDTGLRASTENASSELHSLIESGATPPPIHSKACFSCSLRDICEPEAARKGDRVAAYITKALRTP